LGDVVVCPAVADRQAGRVGATLEDEVGLLIVHGVLHLLNYDHAEPEESETMKRRERELLTRFRALERNGEQPPT
jgi:probable rRNA maturation factor